jgi:hypothetical protein
LGLKISWPTGHLPNLARSFVLLHILGVFGPNSSQVRLISMRHRRELEDACPGRGIRTPTVG